jgi:hypothetical protein
MSNENQKPAAIAQGTNKPNPSSNDGGRVEIVVSILKLVAPTDVPGNDSTSSVKAGGKLNERRWEIAYLPWMRHFRITYLMPNQTTATKVMHLHETRVSIWE